MASASHDNTAKIWDIAKDKSTITLTATAPINCVSFSPDGKSIATGASDFLIKTWNTASGKELRTLKGHQASVYAIAYSRDGR